MAASLFEKARLLVTSLSHSLLDRQLDDCSIEVLEQILRDLENALRDLRGSLADTVGRASAAKQRIGAIEGKITTTTQNIETFLSDDDDSNDRYAEPLGVNLVRYEAELEAAQEELASIQVEQTALESTEDQLEAKLEEAQSRVGRLKSLARQAAAQEKVAKTVSGAASALGMSGAASVDDIENRIRARSGAATAKLGQAMGELDGAGGAEAALRKSVGASRVAEIRAEMARKKAAASGAS